MPELRAIPGFDGYFADSDGFIHSTKRKGRDVKKGQLSNNGYLRVLCNKQSVPYNCLVHRLVASAFLGPPADKMQVNHKDGNKKNNSPSNLEYVTASTNIRHSFALGLSKPLRQERNPGSKLKDGQVEELRKLEGKFTQAELASVFGVCQQTISDIFRGKRRARE